jgi:surfactin synthase thioesterase subunit
MASSRVSLTTLRKLISETDLILSTTELPENRTARCRELLTSAIALADDLLSHTKPAKASPAALLGRKGGSVTAQRGSDYFRQLAARRKSHGGGRPRKETE